jgi:hypothetical protein
MTFDLNSVADINKLAMGEAYKKNSNDAKIHSVRGE